MALFCRRYALSAVVPFQPLDGSLPPHPGPWPRLHVTYEEFYRKKIKPGEIEPLYIVSPRMTYQDGLVPAQVMGVEITHLPTGLGYAATGRLRRSIDAGAEFFTLLIPSVTPNAGAVEAVSSIGFLSRTAGPDFHMSQTPLYSAVTLHGTYSEADVAHIPPEPKPPTARRRTAAKRG